MDRENWRLARQVGIAAYLVKPVRQSRLLNAVISAMGMEAADAHNADLHTGRRFAGASVLLVEDHPVNQEVGKAMLEQLGCSVEVAGNGRIALDLYFRELHDLILMDCQMPEMDGYEATRAIRSAGDSPKRRGSPYPDCRPHRPRPRRGQGKVARSGHGRPSQQALHLRPVV